MEGLIVSRMISIVTDQVQMKADLNNSSTADLIWENLPIEGKVSTWGEEIYFEIPVKAEHDNAVSIVEEGDLAYWPEGCSFCIFFGQTPASTAGEIRPASPVNLVGRLLGDPKKWNDAEEGSSIILKKAES